MSKSISISECKELLSRFNKEQLIFIGTDRVHSACEYLSLSGDKQKDLEMKWYGYVSEYLTSKKVSKEMRDFIQFFQILIKTN